MNTILERKELEIKPSGLGTIEYQDILVHIGNTKYTRSKIKKATFVSKTTESFLAAKKMSFVSEKDQYNFIIQIIPTLDTKKVYYFPYNENKFGVLRFNQNRKKWYYTNKILKNTEMNMNILYVLTPL